jgi:hypothetical protein
MRTNVTKFDVDSPSYDPEWGMEDGAEYNLFPVHLFNSISTVVSLFGFMVWLFFSPHMADVARDLDRTCMKPRLYLSHVLLPSSCLRMSFFLLYSGQLFCPSVAGKPDCCCVIVRVKLRANSDSKLDSSFSQPDRVWWAVRYRDEPPVPSLPRRKGARHDQTVRHLHELFSLSLPPPLPLPLPPLKQMCLSALTPLFLFFWTTAV